MFCRLVRPCFFMVSGGNHLIHGLGWEAAFLSLPVYLIFLFPLRHDMNFQRLQKFLGKTLSGIIFEFLFPVSALLLFPQKIQKKTMERTQTFSCQFSSFHLAWDRVSLPLHKPENLVLESLEILNVFTFHFPQHARFVDACTAEYGFHIGLMDPKSGHQAYTASSFYP